MKLQSSKIGRSLVTRLTLALGSLFGWQLAVEQPFPAKCVVIGGPHTSNWDLVAAMYLALGTGVRLRWLAKDELFRGPFGRVWSRLGGWPVNRRSNNNLVEQIVDAFAGADEFRMCIVPEGTRSRASYWKTGFYYTAVGAGVPIALGYADYRLRTVGVGPLVMPTGDIHADFEVIRAFYVDKTGRHPKLQGTIQLQPTEGMLPPRTVWPAAIVP